jgi:hypothetical protein
MRATGSGARLTVDRQGCSKGGALVNGTSRGSRGVLAVALALVWSVVGLATLGVAIWTDPPTGAWAGILLPVLVATALSVVAYLAVTRDRPSGGVPPEQRAPVSPDRHRILVVANEALRGPALREEVRRRAAERPTDVLVVAPALSTAIAHWTDAEEGPRRDAAERLRETCAGLGDLGVQARGEVGADDPLLAVEDALRTFGADEIVVSTHPADTSNWLELGVVDRLREFYEIPIVHVVVEHEQRPALLAEHPV